MSKRSVRVILGCLAGVVLLVIAANLWVLRRGGAHLRTMDSLPEDRVGLVLGTSPRLGGASNRFFEGRMNTAARLYKLGKVRHLLLSGDNRHMDYNEPAAMRTALLQRGIPAADMTLDRAGFRTLDSVARSGPGFGFRRVVIITDDFHQPRALFLAAAFGLDAVGFASEHVPLRFSLKTIAREWGARVKACLDVYLFHTKPRFEFHERP